MASNALRVAVFDLLVADSALNDLGFTSANIAPNFSPEGPAGDLFMTLRWGTTQRGIGAVNRVRLQVWPYNRQPDYAPIANALLRVRALLPSLAPSVMEEGQAIISVDYEGDSDDLYDDGYRAYTRWTEHTLTASGS